MKKKKISESISVSTEQHNFFIENYCWVWIYVYLCVRTVPIDSNAIYDYFIRFHWIVGVSEYLMQIIHSIFFEILIQSNDGCMDMRFFRNKNDYIIVPKPHLIWRTLQSGNSKTGWHLISTILFFCSLARSLDSLALNFKAIWNMTWKKRTISIVHSMSPFKFNETPFSHLTRWSRFCEESKSVYFINCFLN